MSSQPPSAEAPKYELRSITTSEEDITKLWQLWHAVFPAWPIDQQWLQQVLHVIPGHHFIHDNGFCLSYLDGERGKIAALGVLPEHHGKGLGTALLHRAEAELKSAAAANGHELKSIEIGSGSPRFWAQMPVDFPVEVKEFFSHRGFQKSDKPNTRDYFKDISSGPITPGDIMDRVSKVNARFVPWSPDLQEECLTKQKALFHWSSAYEILAAYGQHEEVLVAIDPETGEQIGWTLMCSPSAIASQSFAFRPLLPTGQNTGLIAAVGIDEKARGKGIGMALVVKAMQSLRERGVAGILVDMAEIRGFYEKMGFNVHWEFESYVKESSSQ